MLRDDRERTTDDEIRDALMELYFDAQNIQELFGDDVHENTWAILDEIRGRVHTAMFFQRAKGKGETR